jgi:signal transduction histidine kinase
MQNGNKKLSLTWCLMVSFFVSLWISILHLSSVDCQLIRPSTLEMRNPLSAIVHCSDNIITSVGDFKAESHELAIPQRYMDVLIENAAAAQIIETCATHQKYIIDSILTLGRLESDMLSFMPSITRPGRLVKSVVDMFDAEFRANNISASAVALPSLKTLGINEVCTDSSRVTQIFINLISNAIKFVKNEPLREIEVCYGACISSPRSAFPEDVHWAPSNLQPEDVSQGPDWGNGEQVYLTFSIRDSGIGIDTDEVSKIFGRFVQANMKTSIRYGGSGLGLFISKQLTQKQGGEIGVSSTVGEGSTFVFYIRVRRALPSMLAPTQKRPSLLRVVSLPGVSHKGPKADIVELPSRLYVLLVEDNVINQQVLRKQLTRAGCIVYVANHGEDALLQIKSMACWHSASKGGPLDVILMDMQMPVMDGLSCTREIRRFEAEGLITKRIPIIAVTANVRDEQVSDALMAGSVSLHGAD